MRTERLAARLPPFETPPCNAPPPFRLATVPLPSSRHGGPAHALATRAQA
jgi:hypothetical protein